MEEWRERTEGEGRGGMARKDRRGRPVEEWRERTEGEGPWKNNEAGKMQIKRILPLFLNHLPLFG